MHPTLRTSASRTGIARLLTGTFSTASSSSCSGFVKTREVARYTAIRDFFRQQHSSSSTRCADNAASWSRGGGVGGLGIRQLEPFGVKAATTSTTTGMMMTSRVGCARGGAVAMHGFGMRAFATSSVRRVKEGSLDGTSKLDSKPVEQSNPAEMEPKPPESATASSSSPSPSQRAEECICKRSNTHPSSNINNGNNNTSNPIDTNANADSTAYPYPYPIHTPPPTSYSPLPPSSHSPFYPETNIDKRFPHTRDHENYSEFFKRLAQSLPHPHRPTRDDFLKVATGFWQRVRIRFKWFTIKSFRKFNADDISAFVTWFLMSQMFWVLLGTTTFFSVIFATANSLRLQHYLARAISDYLTSETGITIIFESAIVPKWKDSALSFKNVYVSCRPKDPNARHLHTHPPAPKKHTAHTAAIGYDVSNHPATHRVGEDEDEHDEDGKRSRIYEDEDTNYTMFDLNIDSVDVCLSFKRWLDGKGLVESAVVRGVRGVVDRRNVFWDPLNPLDPASFRHEARPGDFELTSLQLEDVLVTVYQPGDFRPYTASIFRADMRMFRKRWAFYDFLCAENVVGQFDNCLFSLHKPQSIGRTNEMDLRDGDWVRMSRIRIDGVNIDHLQNSTTMEGPISWITSGKVDAVLDIKFPRDPNDEMPFNAILEEIAEAITTSLANVENLKRRIPGQRELAKPPLEVPRQVNAGDEEVEVEGVPSEGGDGRKHRVVKPKVVIDIDLRFRDLKAAVPIFTSDLSYVNNALIRPIVAFMNANRTLIPIRCRVVKDLEEFDGSWTMWETGLMDEISLNVYEALAYHVSQSTMNRQRMKTVSLWSLHMTASAVMSALRTAMDPMGKQLREVYMTSRARAEEAARVAAALAAEASASQGQTGEEDDDVREVVGFYGALPLAPLV